MQSVPFLVAGLVMVATVIGLIAFWPFGANQEDLMQRANLLLSSQNHNDWREARSLYERVMRSANDVLATEAEEKYYLARRKSMLHRLDNQGITGLDKPEIRRFYRAYDAQKLGRFDEAIALYRELVDHYDHENEVVYVFDEAQSRLDHLVATRQQADDVREELLAALEEAETLSESNEGMLRARAIWRDIIEKYADNEFLQDFVLMATTELESGATELPDEDRVSGQGQPEPDNPPDEGSS